MLYQPPLPPTYGGLSDEELRERIAERKSCLGNRLVILGHHYQRDDVLAFADFRGDSLRLSQIAAEQDVEFVIFCGVHFMAESADILTGDDVRVVLPDLAAGCTMADMANLEQLEEAWDHLTAVTDAKIVPITYVNSAASIKAFCGGHDGACCTSSNARRVLEWALDGAGPADGVGHRKVLFLPDQHLGRNTAYQLGWPLGSMAVYDPNEPDGGLREDEIRRATFLLWKGHCSVHQLFTADQVDEIRSVDQEYQVIVHPECPWEVVQKADLAGSTSFIIRTIEDAPAGSKWAVGTEIHLVHRLAKRFEGQKVIRLLAGIQCLCTTMYRIDLRHLLWCLDEMAAWSAGPRTARLANQISVDPETKVLARVALQRMLALAGDGAAKPAAAG